MRVSILRQQFPGSASRWETFEYDGPMDNSVAGVLDYINYHDDIVDVDGRRTTRIGWECSCLQGVCGACAMVINGKPALACETFVRDIKEEEITIRPLRKFPVIHDLVVDRSSIHENLKQANVCIGEYRPSADDDHAHQYAAAKCLKCGLCLEVCPNYVNGHTFFGAAFANDCYLVASRNRAEGRRIRTAYAEHFGKTCSKSLSCMEVCPMRIPTLASMARLNRMKR
jgi:succinate dehydrogenase / fumarate reductase iron-sulfur subunit